MSWFSEWWLGINLAGQIMACLAVPTTIILILQAIIMLAGAGFGNDSDGVDSDGADIDADGADFDSDGFDTDGADFDSDGFDADGADFDSDGFDVDSADFDSDGFDADGADFDSGGHGHPGSGIIKSAAGSSAHPLKILTVRGFIAFFAIGGWAGLAAITAGVPTIFSVQIALLAGVAAMILSSVVIRFALKMQSSGNIDLRNAINQIADVYITIPPSRSDTGKIMLLIQERFSEIEAVTDEPEAIKSNTKVVVVGLMNRDCLIVRPYISEKNKSKGD